MVKCTDCKREIRKVADIRDCDRCQRKGAAAAIPPGHANDDWLTPAIIGYAIGGGFSPHHSDHYAVEQPPAFTGGGGETSGAGAGGTFEPEPSRDSPSEPSVSSDSGTASGGDE